MILILESKSDINGNVTRYFFYCLAAVIGRITSCSFACTPLRLSVCLAQAPNLKTKGHRETKYSCMCEHSPRQE